MEDQRAFCNNLLRNSFRPRRGYMRKRVAEIRGASMLIECLHEVSLLIAVKINLSDECFICFGNA